jgi:tetrahydromethanopterin S-methyltransferase subunit G
MMCNAGSLAFTLILRPFKAKYLFYCAVVDELLTTVASATMFIYYQKFSQQSSIDILAYVLYGCIGGMMLLSVAFMIMEIIRRTKPTFSDIDAPPPRML